MTATIGLAILDAVHNYYQVAAQSVTRGAQREAIGSGIVNAIGGAIGGAPTYLRAEAREVKRRSVLGGNRLSTMLTGLTCGGLWFMSTADTTLYFSRLYQGLVFGYAASELLGVHLVGRWRLYNKFAWAQIAVIYTLYTLTGKLLTACIACICCACLDYMRLTVADSGLVGPPLPGGELRSRDRYGNCVQTTLTHILNHWMVCLRLRGCIFYPAIHEALQHIHQAISQQAQNDVPSYRRLRYVLLDMDHASGMDPACVVALKEFIDEVAKASVSLLCAGADPDVANKLGLHTGGVPSEMHDVGFVCGLCFVDCQEAVGYAESAALQYRLKVHDQLVSLHPYFKICSDLRRRWASFDPFTEMLKNDAARFTLPWQYCQRMAITKHETVLWQPGEAGRPLFIVHRGAVGIYHHNPEDGLPAKALVERQLPQSIHRHGRILNFAFLGGRPTEDYAIAIGDGEMLFFSDEDWQRMSRDCPALQKEVLSEALRQHEEELHRCTGEIDRSRSIERLVMSSMKPTEVLEQLFPLQLGKPTAEGEESADVKVTNNSYFTNVNLTQRLEDMGLYDARAPDDEGYLASVPPPLRRCLGVSFEEAAQTTDGGEALIPFESLPAALQLAGLCSSMPCAYNEDDVWTLSQDDFTALALEGVLARLSAKQKRQIECLFVQIDADMSGGLTKDELVYYFGKHFHVPDIERHMNEMLGFWDFDRNNQVTLGEFTSIMARLVRLHDLDRLLLQAVRDLVGKPSKMLDPEVQMLTAHHLVTNAHTSLDIAVAEELLWVVNLDFARRASSKMAQVDASVKLPLVAYAVLFDAVGVGVAPPMWHPKPLHAAFKVKDMRGDRRERAAAEQLAAQAQQAFDVEAAPRMSNHLVEVTQHWAPPPRPPPSQEAGEALAASRKAGGRSGNSGSSGNRRKAHPRSRPLDPDPEGSDSKEASGLSPPVAGGGPQPSRGSGSFEPGLAAGSRLRRKQPAAENTANNDQTNAMDQRPLSPALYSNAGLSSRADGEADMYGDLNKFRKGRWRQDANAASPQRGVRKLRMQRREIKPGVFAEPMPFPQDMLLDFRDGTALAEAVQLSTTSKSNPAQADATAAAPAPPVGLSALQVLVERKPSNAWTRYSRYVWGADVALESQAGDVPTWMRAAVAMWIALTIVADMYVISAAITNEWQNCRYGLQHWMSACSAAATSGEDSCTYLELHIGCLVLFAGEFYLRFIWSICVAEAGGLQHLSQPLVFCDAVSLVGLLLDAANTYHPAKFYVTFRLPRLIDALASMDAMVVRPLARSMQVSYCSRQPQDDGAPGQGGIVDSIMQADWLGLLGTVIILLLGAWAVFLKAAEDHICATDSILNGTSAD
eukprot:TRINITY_DN52961_c0_g2_i1.p1 TRINITY_DN52961_c0_g2~~TRINITY_DN52961_c0_g2_i1.p1  ORF type:complete len:1559 (-),score=259.60 TRINITY_DN52961_c0_g2_i1:354-4406(-)